MPTVPSRARRSHRRRPARTAGVCLGALLLTLVSLALPAPPAAAFSNFAITVTSDQPLIAGSTADLHVTVRNAGPDPADSTTLEVGLPAGLTTAPNAQCVAPNDCLIGGFGLLNPGDSETRVVRVDIDPDYVVDNGGGGALANAVINVAIDYDAGSQNSPRIVQVGEASDLRINKYVNPVVAQAGQPILYTIDVDNLGPSTARNVTIRDTLFAGVTQPDSTVSIQSCAYSVSQGGGLITQFNCTTGPIFTSQFGNDIGTMATDMLQPIGMYPNPPDPPVMGGRARAAFFLSVTEPQEFTNEARVVSDTADPDASNNISAVPHSVEALVDLSVTDVASSPTAEPGDLITSTITATNDGPSTAHNVVVEAQLPAGVELVSATTPDGVCVGGTPGDLDDPVRCLLGTIARPDTVTGPFSEVVTIVWRVMAPPGTELVQRAFVHSDEPDPVNADDGAQSAVMVTAPDLLFNPLVPERQFDTRTGSGGVPVGKVAGGTTLEFTATGVNGVPVGAAAVALNVTVEGPDASGWVKVFPCATPGGTASNVNYLAGQTVANAVIAPVDAAGKVCFQTTATTNIISDVSGWFRPAMGLTTMAPVREFDTRDGTGGVPVGPLSDEVLTFDVTGVNGVPAAGVGAVVLNVTAAEPSSFGHATVFPCGVQPFTSNLNFGPGASVPNLVVAPVAPDGTVCFGVHGTTDLVADVSGWFATGSDQLPLNPSRVFDTRDGLGGVPAARVLPGAVLEVDVTGVHGVPGEGVGAVILNVTATRALADGHVTVFPCGDPPLASNVNVAVGQDVANAVLAPVSPDGTVCLTSNVSLDLLADVSGWFTGVPTT